VTQLINYFSQMLCAISFSFLFCGHIGGSGHPCHLRGIGVLQLSPFDRGVVCLFYVFYIQIYFVIVL